MSQTVSKTRSEDDRLASVYDDPAVVAATRRRDELREQLANLDCDAEQKVASSREIAAAAVALLDNKTARRRAVEVQHDRAVLEAALNMADQRVMQAVIAACVPVVEASRAEHAEKLTAVFAATVNLQQALLDEEAFIDRLLSAGVYNAPIHFVRPGAFLPSATVRTIRLLSIDEAGNRLAKHGIKV
jgi:saccharopine dehydrogenase-like NADP-dependent oxidoreductase